MMWKYILAWFPMIVLAVLNGVVREFIYMKSLGDFRANQVSTILLLLVLGCYIWVVMKKWTPVSSKQTWFIGSMWCIMTILFETLYGHYGGQISWNVLFEEYNIFSGRLWILIPLFIATAPYFLYRLKK